jgi:tyrosyl-tRNA synthetase
MDLYSELAWRGLVYDETEGVRDALAAGQVTGYIGFDPTAASLHVGSLLPMVTLAHLQRAGHAPIAVVGGGTGLIGDPSGKTAERQLLTSEQVERNVEGIRAQLARVLDFESTTAPARLVNNGEWLSKLSAIDFMRDVGKHFTVNAMLAKESVKRRIESEEGITYTEFSYSLLQAYDFLVLFDRFGCTLQMGGSDQWGNIVAGMDLIRRLRGGKAHGLVLPLITTASGTKFGKTEAGTVWLDPNLTSPYEFYQFWFNVDDRDAVRYLKFFTFLGGARIAELEAASVAEPEKRHAQRELARQVTALVHGDEAVRAAEASSASAFSDDLTSEALDAIFGSVPSSQTTYVEDGWPMPAFLTANRITTSNGEAVRLIRGGGITINNKRIANEKERLMPADAIDARYFLVKKGKKERFLVRIDRG